MDDGPGRAGPARRLGLSIRARTTAVAVAVVGLALVTAAVALVLVLRVSLQQDVVASAEAEAGNVAALLREGSLPRPVPIHHGSDVLIQVVDGPGRVIAWSANGAGKKPVSHIVPPLGHTAVVAWNGHIGAESGHFKVVAMSVRPRSRPAGSAGGTGPAGGGPGPAGGGPGPAGGGPGPPGGGPG
ncbi:MAG: hypothetical protein ACYDH5_19050, partial [Acidimicrobiales bacterium]